MGAEYARMGTGDGILGVCCLVGWFERVREGLFVGVETGSWVREFLCIW